MSRAFITGVEGRHLSSSERDFVRDAQPWGFILFRRNVDTPAQVKALVAELREAHGGNAPILIDQEGGRVQRLGPPHWPTYPAGAAYARLYEINQELGLEAARLGARLIASDLAELGIDVDCLPLADVPTAEANAVISDRAYGATAQQVAALARAIADGLLAGGVLPVLKHLPGHGRANADSHERLPVVAADRAQLEATDFAAFQPLADLPLGMTAHVVYAAIDPILPATTSATVISDVIRGHIGFSGALMSDDLSMGALSGTLATRSQQALDAGCDLLLHCNGNLAEMQEVAAEAPELAGEAARRASAALAMRGKPEAFDREEVRVRFAGMMSKVRITDQAAT
ncbi:MAG: beta-N-acetylhexosaminidase [Variibacter sp.]|nr:beta-N-acetylhexosaminidase [Variibacter sp.]